MIYIRISRVQKEREVIHIIKPNLKGFVGIADVYNFSSDDHCGLTKDTFEMLTVKNGLFVPDEDI